MRGQSDENRIARMRRDKFVMVGLFAEVKVRRDMCSSKWMMQ